MMRVHLVTKLWTAVLVCLLVRCVGTAKVAVIGAGYAGLCAANELQRLGHEVVLFEQGPEVGGRARAVQSPDGRYSFDAGPSFYWMPDLYETVFKRFGKNVDDYYSLERLDPAYRAFVPGDVCSSCARVNSSSPRLDESHTAFVDVNGTLLAFLQLADDLEPGHRLREFFREAGSKYHHAVEEWMWKPMAQWREMVDLELMSSVLQYDMLGSYQSNVYRYTKHPLLRMLVKWPVIFVGASPADAPALFSLLTYAGHATGSWYPSGGMKTPARALAQVARESGVDIRLNEQVVRFRFDDSESLVSHVCAASTGTDEAECLAVDGVLSAADYHFVEQKLLLPHLRRYTEDFWQSQVLSPSALVFYLGFRIRLPGLSHHTFFFDGNFDGDLKCAFQTHCFPESPTFYVTASARTDLTVAPAAGEAIFVLVPLSYRLNSIADNDERRARILNEILRRMEELRVCEGEGFTCPDDGLRSALEFEQTYGPREYERDFNAFRGNAFGLANLLSQSLILRPSMQSLAPNLVFAGHMCNPGPGVPPAMVSGIVAAGVLDSALSRDANASFWQEALLWNERAVMLFVKSIASYANQETQDFMAGFIILSLICAGLLISSLLVLSVLKYMCRSQEADSYSLCVRLLHEHGRTYFAAASLMGWSRLCDTAALYGFCRVVDNLADCPVTPSATKYQKVLQMKEDTFRYMETGVWEPQFHPVLLAFRSTVLRLKINYRDLFERFFVSMEMDAKCAVSIRDFEGLEAYMDGSAAMIGELMLPVLFGGKSVEHEDRVLSGARALGNAFQLTNMIRDIAEDAQLGRVYIPADQRATHNVVIETPLDCKQENWPALLEEMMGMADRWYEEAENAVALLPEDVRPVIGTALKMYQGIHDKIRSANYDVATRRLSLSLLEKALYAMRHTVGFVDMLRIITCDVVARTYFSLLPCLPHLVICVLFLLLSTPYRTSISYMDVHVYTTGPMLLYLSWAALRRAQWSQLRWACVFGAILCFVATAYTFPWDSYLVYKSVWGFGENRVSLLIGNVPVEEVLFFSLETLLVVAVWLLVVPDIQGSCVKGKFLGFGKSAWSGRIYAWGHVYFAASFVLGLWAWNCGLDRVFYFACIELWSVPVLWLQWCVGFNVLWAYRWKWGFTVLSSTLLLCLLDIRAMENGVWFINARYSIGDVLPGLPLEECLFFAVSSCMCCWALCCGTVAGHVADFITDDGSRIGFRSALSIVRDCQPDWFSWTQNGPRIVHRDSIFSCQNLFSMGILHRVVIIIALLIFLGCVTLLPGGRELINGIPLSTQIWLLVVPSLLIGLPHGGIDPLIMHKLARTVQHRGLLWGGYVVLMGLTYAAWCWKPVVAFAVFLVQSVLHFGEGDVIPAMETGFCTRLMNFIRIVAHGGLFLNATNGECDSAAKLFAIVLGQPPQELMAAVDWMYRGCIICLLVTVGYYLLNIHRLIASVQLMELVLCLATFCMLPPLIAFGLYFNGIHAIRHIERVRQCAASKPLGVVLIIGVVFTFLAAVCVMSEIHLTIGLGAVGAETWTSVTLRSFFVGLSVLTTPHMFIVFLMRNSEIRENRNGSNVS